MSLSLRVGKQIDPSGFAIAVVDVPRISPEVNISLVDNAYLWEENITSANSGIIQSYVASDGLLPSLNSSIFLTTNITVPTSNDMQLTPLFYKYLCRFYHYSYGYNPAKHIYITDQYENILKGINYLVRAEKIDEFIYKIEILSDFTTGDSVIYKVKYNRCNIDGSNIYPSWVETFNAQSLFNQGNPNINAEEYSIAGPGETGLYIITVPATPKISQIINSIGVSFENAPTFVEHNATNVAEYSAGVTVTYTITAVSSTTFNVKRNYTRDGTPASDYLTSATSDSWGATTPFSTSTVITGVSGVTLYVNNDNLLNTNDVAYFTASRSYYYTKPTSYEAIYLIKPPFNSLPDDDWYLRVSNGTFIRRMDASGNVVPSGQGTLWEYGVPEYEIDIFDPNYRNPYKDVYGERAVILDLNTVQLSNIPLYIESSGVLLNPNNPGYPPSGIISVRVNNADVIETNIVDWDLYNGTLKLAQNLIASDNIQADYIFKKEYCIYPGFWGSGAFYTDPASFYELNLNPSPDLGYGVYASGLVATVFLRPYMNADTGTIVNSDTLYHNFTGISETTLNPSLRPDQTDFNLGTVSLGPNCKIEDIKVIDVRNRGGGLSKLGVAELENVKEVQPESNFFWDIGYFDGQAVPADGVLVIKVPKRILKSNGGIFNEDEVLQRIMKHMALGTYAIVEYT